MDADLTHEDAESVGQTLRSFLKKEVEPKVERPEEPLQSAALSALTHEACELGLVNLEAEEGYGLWEMAELPNARQTTLNNLKQLAQVSAGIALHFHQLALGAWLARRLGVCDGKATSFDLLGTYGMGRDLLPRLLRGGTLDADDRTWLAGYFEPSGSCPRLLQLGSPVHAVLMARYDASDDTLAFEQHGIDALGGERLQTSHGLDETETLVLRSLPSAGARLCTDADPRGIATYSRMLEMHSLGVCAISVGAQHQSRARAAEYAELRVQGGTEIIHHAAVQRLLGRTSAAAASGDALLDGLGGGALSKGSLVRSLAARAGLLVEGCAAANDALQVFGGSGYIRDNGLEKLVRDQNHLRVFWGTPGDLMGFVTELEREA